MIVEDDKKRFTEIYNRESGSLFRFCLLRVSDREQALDIVAESFTRYWVAVSSGKAIENPRAYLFVVVRHLIIDWYKKSKSISLESLSEEDGIKFEVPDEEALSNIEIHSDAKKALTILNNMNPLYREVIYLNYIEGFPPKDIALMLNINAGTVSVRINRGLEDLRKLMGIKEQ